jgi:thiol:disulfide interchange protein DsbC
MTKAIVLKSFAILFIIGGVVLSLSGFSTPTNLTEHDSATDLTPPVELATQPMPADLQALKTKLSTTIGVEVQAINPAAIDGMMEVVTNQGLFYTSRDGQYLLHGQLFSLGATVTNLTEQSLAKVRVDGMAKFADDMIVFPAKNEQHVITVFTDNSCAYCRKMHTQMQEFNDKGITVRYLAYPRQGIKDQAGQYTQNFKDMRSIWCADDPQQAMTDGKNGKAIPYRICKNPVEAEFDFGRQVGVTGTPAIMFSNGFMLPGYRQPDDVLAILQNIK